MYNSDSSVFLAGPTGGSNTIFFTLSVVLLQCSTLHTTVTAVCSWRSLLVVVTHLLHPVCCSVAVLNSMYNSDSSVFLAGPTGGSNTIFFTLSVVPLQCSTLHTTVTAVCSWRSLLVVVTPSSSPCLLFRCSAQLYVQQ